jgi:hypothetical protein
MNAQLILCTLEKTIPKLFASSGIFEKLSKVSQGPMGENWQNLVTLLVSTPEKETHTCRYIKLPR